MSRRTARRERPRSGAVLIGMAILAGCTHLGTPPDAITERFATAGDAIRGREVFLAREGGHCVLCHSVPEVKVAGDLGPSLAGIGARLTPGQIRLRIADISRINPQATMPSFHRTEGLTRVAPQYAGKPVLTGQQVEDLVAWLGTLR